MLSRITISLLRHCFTNGKCVAPQLPFGLRYSFNKTHPHPNVHNEYTHKYTNPPDPPRSWRMLFQSWGPQKTRHQSTNGSESPGKWWKSSVGPLTPATCWQLLEYMQCRCSSQENQCTSPPRPGKRRWLTISQSRLASSLAGRQREKQGGLQSEKEWPHWEE